MILLPQITAVRELGETVRFELRVSDGLGCFEGHFPGKPILPGVVQVQWAIRFGSQCWPQFQVFRSLHKLKFQNPIIPGMDLTLELTPGEGVLSFRYLDHETVYSVGRILFASP